MDEEPILERIDELVAAEKRVGRILSWAKRSRAGFDQLECVVPLSIRDQYMSGHQARIVCRSDLPDNDVYGQLEVYLPEVPCQAHFQRVDWRPVRSHTNNSKAPEELRYKVLKDRVHPYPLNRVLGLRGLRQQVTTIASPLDEGVTTFKEFVRFVGEFWRVDGLEGLPQPPWEGRLL